LLFAARLVLEALALFERVILLGVGRETPRSPAESFHQF